MTAELRVAVIGCGAIGETVARFLASGQLAGARLVGVVHAEEFDPPGLPVCSVTEAIDRADLVVECAGQQALIEFGPQVLAAGVDLLVVSTGALTDDAVLEALRSARGGRVYLSTGAIGGIELLRAAALAGPFDSVRIVTTKRATTLIQPWMSERAADELRAAEHPVELKRGSAREVAQAFPKSANVAASVALAVGSWDCVEAVVIADPAATLTSHVITARGPAGDYRFEIRNQPSAQTPATSALVPFAVLRAIADRVGARETFL